MRKILILLLLTFSWILSAATSQDVKDENVKIKDYGERIADLYKLDAGENYKDITDQVLASSDTLQSVKDLITQYQRRIYVFKYPSDGLTIYGFISVTPNEAGQPLEVLFRGGNRKFGLPNPGNPTTTYKDVTVISSTLRGGISEGQDEFGVADLDDIKNMIAYIPTLEQELNITLHPSYTFALGSSRGGMEMFLSMEKYPELQNFFDKAVSLSGLLDVNDIINEREDMKQMFIDDFGLQPGVNDEQWIAARNPIGKVSTLRPSLSFLIIQGTEDQRIPLKEGHDMTQKLQQNGNTVTYWEINGGNHTLANTPYIMERLVEWVSMDK